MSNNLLSIDRIDQKSPPNVSIVAPAFNEEDGLFAFYDAVSLQLEKIGECWEIIFVNDGSSDQTMDVLHEICRRDSRVRAINFSRNFGNQIAVSAGLQHAQGNAVIVMDADLQHPPEIIPVMLQLWRDGNHVVYTKRTYGKEISRFKKISSDVFCKVMNSISDVKFEPGVSDFRLLDRVVVDYINAMPEKSRFVRGIVQWLGFNQVSIPYTAAPRFAGVSKFSFVKLLKLAAEGITGFSTKPLRWILYLGFFTALSGMPYMLWAIYQYIFIGTPTPGWASLIVAILFLGGVQLISLGVIGEYVGRIYTEVKQRPLYTIQEKIGFHSACNSDSIKKAA